MILTKDREKFVDMARKSIISIIAFFLFKICSFFRGTDHFEYKFLNSASKIECKKDELNDFCCFPNRLKCTSLSYHIVIKILIHTYI